MLVALDSYAAHQSCATTTTPNHMLIILDYTPTHPAATIWYAASFMIITVHSQIFLKPKLVLKLAAFDFSLDSTATPFHHDAMVSSLSLTSF
jgi:hypothetical protein